MAKKKTSIRKKAIRKPTAKKTVVATPRGAAERKPKAVRRATAITTPLTKSQIVIHIAQETALRKKDVLTVFDALEHLIERHIKKRGVGAFMLFGLAKIMVVRKKATKAHKGINPFTGEATVFKAKPARNVVKIRPLKRLKDMVG